MLLPLVLQRCIEGALFLPAATLIELYRNTRDRTILDLLVRRGDHLRCAPLEQCTLLELGLSEVEASLCDYLWENWHKTGEYLRGYVARALGNFGTQRSRELLEVIQFKLAGLAAEKQARIRQMTKEEADQVDLAVATLEVRADDEVLEKVRVAVQEIQRRLESSSTEGGASSAEAEGASRTDPGTAAADPYPLASAIERKLIQFLLRRLKSTGSDW